MYRTTNLFVGLVLLLGSVAVAQDSQLTPPQVPEDAMQTRQLIAWSSLQKPQPAPQPLPPPDTPIPQPDQQADQQPKPPADPNAEQSPTAQSFRGKVVKDGGKYVLKVAQNTSYQLDGDVGKYENQNVKIVGKLDKGSNTIHVDKIELLS